MKKRKKILKKLKKKNKLDIISEIANSYTMRLKEEPDLSKIED